MAGLADWRDRAPVAALLAGILSLCISGGLYLIYGRLERPALVFLVLGVGLLVLYLLFDFQSAASAFSGRHARYGGNTAAMILIFLGIVAVLNFLAVRHSYRFDLTASREFSISPQTVKILQSLQEPVQVKAFFRNGDYGRGQAQDLLKEYQRHSDKVQFEFVDWEARPADAIRYGLQSFPAIVMESGGRRQDVNSFTEQDLTGGIFKVSQGEAKRVFFTTGHGEPDLVSVNEAGIGFARQALEANNYRVDTINLATTPVISDDVAGLVVYAPKNALLDQEKQAIKDYLSRGGKAMVLIAPKRTADLSDLLAPYGLQVGDGIAIDQKQALNGQPYVPVVTSYPQASPITGDLQQGKQAVLLPLATQIGVAQQLPAGVEAARLLETTDASWLATDDKDITYHQGDVKGPLTLAVAVTADAQGGGDQAPNDKTRLVVFGSADFAGNIAIDALANRQLFVNAANWLTKSDEAGSNEMLSIQSRPTTDRTLTMTGAQTNLLVYSSVLFLPLAVAVAGGLVWWNRR